MISIAMTTYNGELYIEKQLLSILNQTRFVDEIVICDDNSTDKTVDIINKIIDEYMLGDRIRLIQNDKNLGYIRNFRQAIENTKGDYIFLADQDDVWDSKKVEICIETMNSGNYDAICTNSEFIDRDGVVIKDRSKYLTNPLLKKMPDGKITEISFHRLVYGNIAQGCTYCFNPKVKEKYLEFDCDTISHDYQIMFIASLIGRVAFLNLNLIKYRIHENNVIGFSDNSDDKSVHKKPKRIPTMVQFINELQSLLHVPHAAYYKFLYYLRIPYFVYISMMQK